MLEELTEVESYSAHTTCSAALDLDHDDPIIDSICVRTKVLGERRRVNERDRCELVVLFARPSYQVGRGTSEQMRLELGDSVGLGNFGSEWDVGEGICGCRCF